MDRQRYAVAAWPRAVPTLLLPDLSQNQAVWASLRNPVIRMDDVVYTRLTSRRWHRRPG